jgi:hypothetical protein
MRIVKLVASKLIKARSRLIIWSIHARPSMDQCVPPYVVIPSQERRSSKLDLVDDVRMFIYRAWWNTGLDQDRIDPVTPARRARTCNSSPSAPSSSAGGFCTVTTVTTVHVCIRQILYLYVLRTVPYRTMEKRAPNILRLMQFWPDRRPRGINLLPPQKARYIATGTMRQVGLVNGTAPHVMCRITDQIDLPEHVRSEMTQNEYSTGCSVGSIDPPV